MKKNTVILGFNTHSLSVEEIGEAVDWREELNPGPQLSMLSMGETFSRKGLQSMVEEAMGGFSEKSGMYYLPWNMAGAGAPWWSLPHHKNFAIHGGVRKWVEEVHPDNEHLKDFVKNFEMRCPQGPVEYAARFCGWLKVAGGKRGLAKALRATTTPNGMGSPYTTVNPFHILERWPSPHRAERQIWKVRKRANQILRPYGISVSWQALGQVIAYGPKRVGKAAVWASAHTVCNYLLVYGVVSFPSVEKNGRDERLNHAKCRLVLEAAQGLADLEKYPLAVQRWAVQSIGEFTSIREALRHADRLVKDSTDGVELYLDPASKEVLHGVSCILGWTGEIPFTGGGRMFLLRQEHTGRTFHESFWKGTTKERVRGALRAWRQQKELERLDADLISFLRGDYGFCPLVYRQDSYRAGNCQPGTESWLNQLGWGNKEFIPAQWLISHLDYNLVRNVATHLCQELSVLN